MIFYIILTSVAIQRPLVSEYKRCYTNFETWKVAWKILATIQLFMEPTLIRHGNAQKTRRRQAETHKKSFNWFHDQF